MVGPTLQDSLFAILIRARQYKYLLTGDIEKMYRQVLVAENDRCLQRILWREGESQPITAYDLNTLTYGTASASYLSTRCLWQLGDEHNDDVIKRVIQKDFYVDDLITGADNDQDLRYIQRGVSEALRKGCFNLRKYKSNNPSIFENINLNQGNLTISESSSTLGLGWRPTSDTLFFPIKGFSLDKQATVTKRFVMSNSFKIFDPLGILSPVIIQPKIMLQKMWQQKLDWDDPVSSDLRDEWLNFTDNLKYLHSFQIPRLVLCDKPEFIELHSFSDASQCAYGACIYLKSVNRNGDTTIKLLCAKSKVSPIKPSTIPRLELCAALMAAKLCKSVLDSLRYNPGKLVHWCDSSVVLSWINNDPTKLKMFVANRVCEIVELTNASSWRYVPTALNPADLISRGMDAKRHFIIGRPLNALPLPALVEKDNNNRNRYKRLETIRQHFWQRWQKEYLSELQQRTKWRKDNAKLNVGDMVLLAEDNTPPLSWRLGRVLRLFPGPDGAARVAEVKTQRGCVRRPFTRLCPLPTADELQA
ncbi:uncharacterized protein LOC142986014 [Anticarsia gemmatalis]|uniref:uncharacterized protein LOC142986014 n=1 Tax=Anticarsia gemmatalis TaxID=129554 RepID=UPI003F757FAA